jgi:hypothetical protein
VRYRVKLRARRHVEANLDQFLANRFGKRSVAPIKAIREQQEGRTIETLWDVTYTREETDEAKAILARKRQRRRQARQRLPRNQGRRPLHHCITASPPRPFNSSRVLVPQAQSRY